jgi:hypothetical protein
MITADMKGKIDNISTKFLAGGPEGRGAMKILFIISTDESETVYNAMGLANTGVRQGDEVSVFMRRIKHMPHRLDG